MVQIQGVMGEAVVIYREPLTTREMQYSRPSRRVNNRLIFRHVLEFTMRVFRIHTVKTPKCPPVLSIDIVQSVNYALLGQI